MTSYVNRFQIRSDQRTVLTLVLVASLLIASSVIFSFWPVLVAVSAIAISLMRFRTALAFVASSTFVVAAMDLPSHDIWIALRWMILGIAAFTSAIIFVAYGDSIKGLKFGLFHIFACLSVASALFSVAVSVSPLMTCLKTLSVLALFTYCAIGIRVAVRNHQNLFLEGATIWSEVLVYICFASYVIFDYQLFPNPNTVGGLIGIVPWPLLFARVMRERNRISMLRYSIPLAVCAYVLILSQSRAAILGAAIATLFICLAYRRVLLSVASIAILTGLVVAFAAYHPEEFDAQVQQLLVKHSEYTTTFESRTDLWQEGLLMIQARPWFGSGFGVTAGMSEGWRADVSSEDANREKGNSFLALIEGLGFIGSIAPLGLLLILLAGIGRAGLNQSNGDPTSTLAVPLAALLLSGLINSFFEAWLFAVGSYIGVFFWITAFVFIDLLGSKQTGLPYGGRISFVRRPVPQEGA